MSLSYCDSIRIIGTLADERTVVCLDWMVQMMHLQYVG